MSKLRTPIDELGPDAARLLRLYRAHATEQPSAALDQRILQMASQAIAQAPGGSSSAPAPRRQHWLRYAASVAVVVVGAGLSWRMLEQGPSPDLAIQRPQVSEGSAAAPGRSAPAAPADQAASIRSDAPEQSAAKADRIQSLGAARARLEDQAEPAVSVANEDVTEAAAAAIAEPAPSANSAAAPLDDRTAPASASAPRLEPLVTPPQLSRVPAAPAAVGATDGARELSQPEPLGTAKPESAAKRLQKMASPLDPDVWLDNIRALRDSKHEDEARVSLREWRLRYPQLPIPADLHALLDQPAAAADLPTP